MMREGNVNDGERGEKKSRANMKVKNNETQQKPSLKVEMCRTVLDFDLTPVLSISTICTKRLFVALQRSSSKKSPVRASLSTSFGMDYGGQLARNSKLGFFSFLSFVTNWMEVILVFFTITAFERFAEMVWRMKKQRLPLMDSKKFQKNMAKN